MTRCPKCRGPRSTVSGRAVCRPCKAAYKRRWRARRKSPDAWLDEISEAPQLREEAEERIRRVQFITRHRLEAKPDVDLWTPWSVLHELATDAAPPSQRPREPDEPPRPHRAKENRSASPFRRRGRIES